MELRRDVADMCSHRLQGYNHLFCNLVVRHTISQALQYFEFTIGEEGIGIVCVEASPVSF